MHHIDDGFRPGFRPMVPTDSPFRQEPISVKKLKKGDADWDTQKTILSWDVDT